MTFRRLCRLVVRIEPLLLVLLVPAIPTPQKLLYLALLVPLATWVCARLTGGHFIERTALDWPLALLLAAVGLSQIIGMNPQYSLPKATFLVWGVIAFYTIVRYVRDAPSLRRAAQFYLLLGLWFTLLGLFGAETPSAKSNALVVVADGIPNYITRLWGFSTDPNNVSAALALFVPLQATMLWAALKSPARGPARRPFQRGAWASLAVQSGAFLLSAAVLILNQSRAALVGMFVALVSLAAWRIARSRPGLAAIIVIVCALGAIAVPQAFAARLTGGSAAGSPFASLVWRQQIWADALPAVSAFPLTGLGIVRLREALPVIFPTAVLSETTLIMRETHNLWLEVAVSFGLPALVAYLAVWLGAAQMTIAVHRSSSNPWPQALVEGLAAGLLANFIFGATGSILLNSKVGIAVWVALGLIAGAYRVARASPPGTEAT